MQMCVAVCVCVCVAPTGVPYMCTDIRLNQILSIVVLVVHAGGRAEQKHNKIRFLFI